MTSLEGKLTQSLNDILKTSGYVFEYINGNKRQSNIITGTNNQIITQGIASQLSACIENFDDILDNTVSKLNDARWCVETIVENKQKQEQTLLKEEERRQQKLKEEEAEEAKRREQEKALAEENRRKQEEDANKRQEELKKKEKDKEEEERKKQEEEKKNSSTNLDNFMSPGFDFNDLSNPIGEDQNNDGIPDPSDILSSINYKDFNTDNNNQDGKDNKLDDLDMNNLLGNDESLLDGLNASLLNEGGENGNTVVDEEFDVDSFLNQFGDGD